MAATFANHVALALELSDAREDAERVSLLEDRDRIARDLHDHVIQRLFATGLGLEGLATGSRDERLARRLADHVSDLDETIRQIRASIFELQHGLHGGSIAIRARLLELADASTRMLGFRPTMKFSGPVDTVITGALAEDVMAVAREALSNVGRHAHSSHAELCLTASAAVVVLEVADDGVGIAPDRGPESGLENIRRRAVQRGGFAALSKSRLGGVLLHWESPLDSAH
jgi:signal transduction histidine kinase